MPRKAWRYRIILALLPVVLASCVIHREGLRRAEKPRGAAGSTAQARRALANALGDRRFPNVIWIVLDACRAENLSCYGYERQTSPNIDRMAERGVVFENHFAQGLWTVFSLPSYMTGRYFPASCLALSHAVGRQPPEDERFISDTLREAGYFAFCVTAHPFLGSRSRLYRAFDESAFVPAEPGHAHAGFDALNARFVPRFSHLHTRPFFLYVHAVDTHFPHRFTKESCQWSTPSYASRYVRDGKPTSWADCRFSRRDKEELRALHDDAIHLADAHIGEMLRRLDEHGLLENTIILIGADHGDALGENGKDWGHLTSFDQVMRTPLVVAGPGIPQGLRINALTENVDIVPTLVDLLALDTNTSVDGKSLLPLLYDENAPPLHDVVYSRGCHEQFVYDDPPLYVIRSAEYKYQYDAFTGQEDLFPVPDNVSTRTSRLAEEPAVATALRERLMSEYAPLWEAYVKQPVSHLNIVVTRDVLEKSLADDTSVAIGDGAMPGEASCTDGKWLFSRRTFWCASWAETAPPLSLRFDVPPNCYRVFMELLVFKDLLGHEASSVCVKAEDDVSFKTLQRLPLASEENEPFFVELGVYDVLDGVLDVTLRQEQRDCWAIVRRFRVVPISGAGSWEAPMEEGEEHREQLRALGYVE